MMGRREVEILGRPSGPRIAAASTSHFNAHSLVIRCNCTRRTALSRASSDCPAGLSPCCESKTAPRQQILLMLTLTKHCCPRLRAGLRAPADAEQCNAARSAGPVLCQDSLVTLRACHATLMASLYHGSSQPV